MLQADCLDHFAASATVNTSGSMENLLKCTISRRPGKGPCASNAFGRLVILCRLYFYPVDSILKIQFFTFVSLPKALFCFSYFKDRNSITPQCSRAGQAIVLKGSNSFILQQSYHTAKPSVNTRFQSFFSFDEMPPCKPRYKALCCPFFSQRFSRNSDKRRCEKPRSGSRRSRHRKTLQLSSP